MIRKNAGVIIALLAIIAVALAVVLGYQLMSGNDHAADSAAEAATTSSAASEPTDSQVEDPAEVLETAGIDVVESTAVPVAPEVWGDYELVRDWGGQINLSEDNKAQSAEGPDGARFPASMNGCGELMYFVPFRASGDSDDPQTAGDPVDAQLIDAVGEVRDSERSAEGWMLGTNCSTPRFLLDSADSENAATSENASRFESARIEVDYTVYEYRRVSEVQSSPARVAPVTPSMSAGPTFVECLFGTPGPARFSDGSVRNHQPCAETPEARRSLRAESVCGGLYGWQGVSKAEYLDLCGGPWPGDARQSTPTPVPVTPTPEPSVPTQDQVPEVDDPTSGTDAPR